MLKITVYSPEIAKHHKRSVGESLTPSEKQELKRLLKSGESLADFNANMKNKYLKGA